MKLLIVKVVVTQHLVFKRLPIRCVRVLHCSLVRNKTKAWCQTDLCRRTLNLSITLSWLTKQYRPTNISVFLFEEQKRIFSRVFQLLEKHVLNALNLLKKNSSKYLSGTISYRIVNREC